MALDPTYKLCVVDDGKDKFVFATKDEAREYFRKRGREKHFNLNHYQTDDRPPQGHRATWSQAALDKWPEVVRHKEERERDRLAWGDY